MFIQETMYRTLPPSDSQKNNIYKLLNLCYTFDDLEATKVKLLINDVQSIAYLLKSLLITHGNRSLMEP